MNRCEVCGGEGLYPIIDSHGRERYSIKCPECFGSGEGEAELPKTETVDLQRDKYERAMAEKRAALAKEGQ
jgi:hypothetical protein